MYSLWHNRNIAELALNNNYSHLFVLCVLLFHPLVINKNIKWCWRFSVHLSTDYLSILYIVNNVVSFVRSLFNLHANNMRHDINRVAFNLQNRDFHIKEITAIETNCVLIGLKNEHQYPQINSRITYKIRYSRACGSG